MKYETLVLQCSPTTWCKINSVKRGYANTKNWSKWWRVHYVILQRRYNTVAWRYESYCWMRHEKIEGLYFSFWSGILTKNALLSASFFFFFFSILDLSARIPDCLWQHMSASRKTGRPVRQKSFWKLSCNRVNCRYNWILHWRAIWKNCRFSLWFQFIVFICSPGLRSFFVMLLLCLSVISSQLGMNQHWERFIFDLLEKNHNFQCYWPQKFILRWRKMKIKHIIIVILYCTVKPSH